MQKLGFLIVSLLFKLTIEPYLGFVTGKRCSINKSFRLKWGISGGRNYFTERSDLGVPPVTQVELNLNSFTYISLWAFFTYYSVHRVFDNIDEANSYAFMEYYNDSTKYSLTTKINITHKPLPFNVYLKYETPCAIFRIIECQSFQAYWIDNDRLKCSLLLMFTQIRRNVIGYLYVKRKNGDPNSDSGLVLRFEWGDEEFYFPKNMVEHP